MTLNDLVSDKRGLWRIVDRISRIEELTPPPDSVTSITGTTTGLQNAARPPPKTRPM